MTGPIVLHSDADHQQAQQRIAALRGEPDSPAQRQELQALADAILAFQLRLDET
ncbi:MAG: hypothetical protein ACRCU1_15295 [Alsobacter sp.]